MTTRAFYAALLLLAMPVAACNAAGPAMASPQEIARSLDGYTSRLKGAAVIVGIVDEGNVKVYESGDLGEGPPKLDETTIFQIGSVTKTFTTTLLASMASTGKSGSKIRCRPIYRQAFARQSFTTSTLRCSPWPSRTPVCRAFRRISATT